MYDYAVIGAGMAGASVAFELAETGSVALIEAEARPGYHSTGRSAALFTPNYGNTIVRRINAHSVPFFLDPPPGFAEHPLLTQRGLLTVAAPGDEAGLDAILALASDQAPVHRLPAPEALALAPLLRPEKVAAAVFEPGVMDIDVDALHQGYLRGLKARGGDLSCRARACEITRRAGHWQVEVGTEKIAARLLINAAGAWADEIAKMAGARPIGLVPKRRSAIVVNAPTDVDIRTMPAVDTIGSEAYFKPEAGRIMASLGDETPTEPQDARPEELDIALIADWLERQTTITLRRIEHSWAGLRSFVADGAPVVGFDGERDDFFWLAGQGGYGIMMAPTLARASRALIQTGAFPDELIAHGVSDETLSPSRCIS
ncbi:FAD-binding oxidoreductase [Pelagibius litoralis]|uniref:FAD-binding oxidoreductase n=1 Tax=Pelagibius litoralis TaxID=374515 RepID=A0A967KIG3_9PROT|nr:FAD-dependent oxidoreductase [Pelagibius litoralis]NIA72256.1 FAD-binding oxidoreductase [Pelagibius litoralis]